MLENSSSGNEARLQINFAEETNKILKAIRSSKNISEIDRDEVISICKEFEEYGADDDLLRRAINVKNRIKR